MINLGEIILGVMGVWVLSVVFSVYGTNEHSARVCHARDKV